MFIRLFTGLVNGSIYTKCIWLRNPKCMIQPTLIDLHPNEYNQEFHWNPFAVKLSRCVGSCNTLNDLSKKVSVPSKTEDLNLSVFNMITETNESKTLIKYTSYKYQSKFDGEICNSNQWWNDNKYKCECKKHHVCESHIFGILLHEIPIMINI